MHIYDGFYDNIRLIKIPLIKQLWTIVLTIIFTAAASLTFSFNEILHILRVRFYLASGPDVPESREFSIV